MNRLAVMALLWLGVLMVAESGVMITRDGKVWSGRIELRPGPALHITGPSGTHQVPLAKVRRAVLGGPIGPSGLRHLRFSLYRGTWLELPDFTALKSNLAGRLPGQLVTLYPYNAQAGYALVIAGELHAPAKGVYQFYLGSDDGARLMLDGKPVIDNDGRHGYRERQGRMQLSSGRHAFRLEYFNHSSAALLRLDWSGPGLARTPLSREGKLPAAPNVAVDPDRELAIRQPGVLAWNGTFIAHEAIALGESKLTFAPGTPDEVALSTVNTTALFYQALSVYRAQALRGGKTGVLLVDGQFFEGKIMKLLDGEVEVQSVLFGRKTYKLESSVVAVLLRATGKPRAIWRVRTRAGMVYVGTTPKVDNAILHLDATPMGPVKLLRDEIEVIEYGTHASPLAEAWRHWDGLDTAARAHLMSRESVIATRAKAIAQAMRQQSLLLQQHQAAIGNLSKGEATLQQSLKERKATVTYVHKARMTMEQANALVEAKSQALAQIKNEVTQSKILLGEKVKTDAVIQARLEKFTAKAGADEKQALEAIIKQKTEAAVQIKASEARIKQAELKALLDQQAVGSAATNRVKALSLLALYQQKRVQVQAGLAMETKEKTRLDSQLAAAKAATAKAQQAQQATQTTLTTKQTLFNSAQAALNAAVTSKQTPAESKLKAAERTFQQATVSKAEADQQLVEFKIELADLVREKSQATIALADLTKVHDAKQKQVDTADVNRAMAEARALMARQKSASSRTALVNLVSQKQEPALAAFRVATNSVVTTQAAWLQADGKLKLVQAEVARAAKTARDTETAARDAEAKSKAIQKDIKKTASEKSAALKEAVNRRQAADAAKAVLANLEAGKLKPAQAQTAAASTAMTQAKRDLGIAEKALPTLGKVIQAATTAFMNDDQAARAAATLATAAAKLHETLKADRVFIAKQRDAALKVEAASEMTRVQYDQQQVIPAAALAIKNQAALAAAEKMRAAEIKATAAVKAGIKNLGQALQISETNLTTARSAFDKAAVATDAARAREVELGKQLAFRQKNQASAMAEITVLDRDVLKSSVAIKQAETEELAKLKPAAESRAALEFGRLKQVDLKKKLANDERSLKAALVDLRKFHEKEMAVVKLEQGASQKVRAEKEKELAGAEARSEAALAARQVALESHQQAKLAHDNHLKKLAEQSKASQAARTQVGALKAKRAEGEAAWLKFLFANRALLNLN